MIGCNDQDAQAYMGCSAATWKAIKARRVVVPIVRGWYSYAMLDKAMEQLEQEAVRKAQENLIYINDHGNTTERREMGSEGHRPRYRPTKELLQQVRPK